jgi:predicted enzyme related to lactoylglutathione lyase
MTVVADPAGAVFHLWQAADHIGARLVNEHGAFIWSELLIDEPDRVASFYETVTGLFLTAADPGDGSSYSGFTLDGTVSTMVAGTVAPPMAGMPAAWIVYFGADDVDAVADRCVLLGGAVMAPPMDIPVGRIAVLTDPQGAVFCLFKG